MEDGRTLITINDRGLFNIEPLREKRVRIDRTTVRPASARAGARTPEASPFLPEDPVRRGFSLTPRSSPLGRTPTRTGRGRRRSTPTPTPRRALRPRPPASRPRTPQPSPPPCFFSRPPPTPATPSLPQPKGPQSISLDLRFPGAHAAYGIPEHASAFALQTTTDKGADGAFLSEPFRLYNLDVYEYLSDSPFGLYGSIPFLLAHSAGGASQGGAPPRTVGAFWLNSAEMYVDVTNSEASVDAHWFAESGIVDLFLMPGPAAQDVWGHYARVTGLPIMPPLFSIAYHQCRWNYKCGHTPCHPSSF